MTREQAAEIITDALNTAAPLDNTLSVKAFATRLAAALDALGLLIYAAAPNQPSEFENRIISEELHWAARRIRPQQSAQEGRPSADCG
jgi:hypothetical protein